MPKSAKSQKVWVYAPHKQAPPPVPAALKQEVEKKAKALVETVLKPHYVLPPPENPQFNYIEDIYTNGIAVSSISARSSAPQDPMPWADISRPSLRG